MSTTTVLREFQCLQSHYQCTRNKIDLTVRESHVSTPVHTLFIYFSFYLVRFIDLWSLLCCAGKLLRGALQTQVIWQSIASVNVSTLSNSNNECNPLQEHLLVWLDLDRWILTIPVERSHHRTFRATIRTMLTVAGLFSTLHLAGWVDDDRCSINQSINQSIRIV